MTKYLLLAVTLAATAATPAAAVVDVTKIPAKTFAVFAQNIPTRGAVPKLAYYKNEDTVKTTGTTVKTPHVTPAVTQTVPVLDSKGKPVIKNGVPQTKVIVITPAVTTYTSVTTYATKITPKSQIYTTIGTGSLLASPAVKFRYLTPFNAYLQPLIGGNQQAGLTLQAISTSAAVVSGTGITQLFNSGSISFVRTSPVMTLGKTPRGLTNLLTIAFTNSVLSGNVGSSAFTLDASTPNSVVTYTSHFLNFENTYNNGISLTFNAAVPTLSVATHAVTAINQTNVTGAHSLVSTRATLAGQFAASSVPEPAVWSLMLAGFAMVGLRRRRPTVVTA